jgi:hypothetical protein
MGGAQAASDAAVDGPRMVFGAPEEVPRPARRSGEQLTLRGAMALSRQQAALLKAWGIGEVVVQAHHDARRGTRVDLGGAPPGHA